MKDTTKYRIARWGIPFLLAGALLVTSLWAAARSARAEAYETEIENNYTRAFAELCGVMDDTAIALGKLQVTNTPSQTVLLLDDVWRLSGSAVSLMSQIPQPHLDTRAMNRFVVQLGDYAHALTVKAMKGIPATSDDREQLDSLYAICTGLARDLNAKLEAGDFPKAGLAVDGYYAGSEAGSTGSDGASANGASANGASAGSGSAEGTQGSQSGEYKEQSGIEDFPTLIYDGPFSESAEKAQPKGLSGSAVSDAEAKAVAEKAAGMPLNYEGFSNGKIKSFEFSGEDENGARADVSVTVQGGHILTMMKSAASRLEGLPPESEKRRYRDTALQYLAMRGYPEMRATYAQYYGGCAIINCAAVQEGVTLYSDLVKVWIDRETLGIVGLDARNYIFSHTQRSLPTPLVTKDDAQGMLSDRLSVEQSSMVLIPMTPETEALCYEFKCSLGADNYIVYIDSQSGEEAQIFRILDSESGQMVI